MSKFCQNRGGGCICAPIKQPQQSAKALIKIARFLVANQSFKQKIGDNIANYLFPFKNRFSLLLTPFINVLFCAVSFASQNSLRLKRTCEYFRLCRFALAKLPRKSVVKLTQNSARMIILFWGFLGGIPLKHSPLYKAYACIYKGCSASHKDNCESNKSKK